MTITFGVEEWEADRYTSLIEAFHAAQAAVRVQQVVLKDVRAFLADGAFDYEAMMLEHVRSADVIAARQVTPALLQRGYVLDLRSLIDTDPSFPGDDYFPGMLDFGAPADGIPLLPSLRTVPVFSYNTELWARAGLPPPAPDWSWEDLLAAADTIAQLGSEADPTYGLATAADGDYALLGLLAEEEPGLFSRPLEQVVIDQPAVERVLQRVADLAERRVVFTSGASDNDFAAQAALDGLVRSGKVGIWLSMLLQENPNSPPGFAIGTAAIPPLPSGNFDQRAGFAISGGTRHPEAAWQWLSFLAAQPGLLAAGGASSVELPARRSLAEQTGFWEGMDDERRAVVEHMLQRPPAGPAAQIGGLVRQPLVTALQAMLQGDQSVRQALTAAQAALDREVTSTTTMAHIGQEPIMVATPVPAAPAAGAVTVHFTAAGLSAADLQPILDRFRRDVPGINIRLQTPPSGAITINTLAASADCFAYPLTPSAEEAAAVVDLQPMVDADPTFPRDDYPPALIERMRYRGALLGLPHRADVRLVFYRRDLLEAAGLAPPDTGWSVDDLAALARQARRDVGPRQMYGLAPAGLSVADLSFFLSRYGIEAFRERDGAFTPNLTDPAVQQQLERVIELLREVSPQAALFGYATGSPAPPPTTTSSTLLWFGDSLKVLSVADGERLGVVAPPVTAGGLNHQDYRVGGLYISRLAPAPDACWTWLRYLSDTVTGTQGGFPARRSLAEAAMAQPGTREEVRAVYEHYAQQWQSRQAQAEGVPLLSGDTADPFWFYRAIDRALRGGDLTDELRAAQQLTLEAAACQRAGGSAGECARQVDPSYDGWNRE